MIGAVLASVAFSAPDASALSVRSFPLAPLPGTDLSVPFDITAGPDGNMWFTGPYIGRITSSGAVTRFPVKVVISGDTQELGSGWMVSGPLHSLWFFAGTNIGRITTSGHITLYPISVQSSGGGQASLARGADGNIWFTFGGAWLGRLTPTGRVTVFETHRAAEPQDLIAGPGRALWFDDIGGGTTLDAIGRMTTDGRVKFFVSPGAFPVFITRGSDGNLWYLETPYGNRPAGDLVRITPQGKQTTFSVRFGYATPTSMTLGPDGNLWFTWQDERTYGTPHNGIGMITMHGKLKVFPIFPHQRLPERIAAGPGHTLWVTEQDQDADGVPTGGRIDRIHLP